MAADAQPGRAGEGAVRRPARRRLSSLERAAGTRARRRAGPAATGGLARTRAQPRGRSRWPGRSPTGTPARWPTCCGWPCRRATPGSRPSHRAPAVPADRDRRRDAGGWARYPSTAPRSWRAPAPAARPPRAVWSALPGRRLAGRARPAVAAAALAGGRGALVVRARPPRPAAGGRGAAPSCSAPDRHVVLTAEAGPAERYRRWLRGPPRPGARGARHPRRRVRPCPRPRPGRALGRRRRPARRAPGAVPPCARPSSRCAPRRRVRHSSSGGSRAPSRPPPSSGPAGRPVVAARARYAGRRPAWSPDDAARRDGSRGARLPTAGLADRTGRAGRRPGARPGPARRLPAGTGLRRVPPPGPLRRCRGPLAGAEEGPPACRWCGTAGRTWACPSCDGRRLRATVVGARRTAEELGRAFPRTLVRTSRRDARCSTR